MRKEERVHAWHVTREAAFRRKAFWRTVRSESSKRVASQQASDVRKEKEES